MKKLAFVFLLLCSVQQVQSASLSESFLILSMYLKNPSEVGEVAPIAQSVGIELATFVGEPSVNGKNYLEAGGGLGAISVCIAEKLQSNDHLDVVEINPEMCRKLKSRLSKYPNVSVHCCSILDWYSECQYDAIISTLPFLSLGVGFTKDAISYFAHAVKKGGTFSCVEYPICVFFRDFAQKFCDPEQKDFTSVQNFMKDVRSKSLVSMKTIYGNIPPINVYHLNLHA